MSFSLFHSKIGTSILCFFQSSIFRFLLMLIVMSFVAYGTTKEELAFFKNGRVTIDLELSFYPFYFASAFDMWLSVIAIVLWFLKTIFKNNKL